MSGKVLRLLSVLAAATFVLVSSSCKNEIPKQQEENTEAGEENTMSDINKITKMQKTVLYVSAEGSDENDGLSPESALASPHGAQKRIRELKAEHFYRHIEVEVGGGVYTLSEPLEQTPEDSGMTGLPTVWRAKENEKPIFSGGVQLKNGKKTVSGAMYDRMPKDVRDSVLVYDLKENGIGDLGVYAALAGYDTKVESRMDLYYDGVYQPLATYPAEGYLQNEALCGTVISYEEHETTKTASTDALKFSDENIRAFADTKGMFLHGYFAWDWADLYRKIDRLDKDAGVLYAEPAPGAPSYLLIKETSRYKFFNVPEQLKKPGSYTVDFENMRLYYLPPKDFKPDNLFISGLAAPVLSLTGTTDLVFDGIGFSYTGASGVKVSNCRNITLKNAAVNCAADSGVSISGGSNVTVENCDISGVGENCVEVDGGDMESLVSANHTVRGNTLHDYGIWKRTYSLGVHIFGTGIDVIGNEVYDAPHAGILYNGRDLLIEGNHIHDIAYETNDVGAIYGGRHWTNQNVIIRNNRIADIGMDPGSDSWKWGAVGIYMDDFQSNQVITGNVVERCGTGILIGGGRFNVIENNYVAQCYLGLSVDDRGKGWAVSYFDGRDNYLMNKLAEVKPAEPPYSERFPHLQSMGEGDPAIPAGNMVRGNLFYKNDQAFNLTGTAAEAVDIDDSNEWVYKD